jgi:hypothetical protein
MTDGHWKWTAQSKLYAKTIVMLPLLIISDEILVITLFEAPSKGDYVIWGTFTSIYQHHSCTMNEFLHYQTSI